LHASARWSSCGRSIGQNDPRFVLPRAIEDAHIANALYEGAAGIAGKLFEKPVALVSIADAGFDLDELMSLERAVQLLRDRGGCAGLADHDDGIATVSESAQVLLLFFGKLHCV